MPGSPLNTLIAIALAFPWALLLARLATGIPSLILHEIAHGLAASTLGDPTAREAGRLRTNPLHHLDGMGTLLVLLMGIGWGRRMPYNPHRARIAAPLAGPLMALSGPLVNLGLAYGASALLASLGLEPHLPTTAWPDASEWLTVAARVNLGLALFSLLPVSPFDGWMLVESWLPIRAAGRWQAWSGRTTLVLGIGLFILLMLPIPLYQAWIWPLANRLAAVLLAW